MAVRTDRFFAWFFVTIFVFSTVAVSVLIIYQATQDDKSANSNQQNNQEANMNPDGPKLAGAPMPGFTPMASIEKLEKIDTTPGSGKEVKPGDEVTVDYTGAVASTGIVFQSSKDSGQPVPLSLKQVIAGWSQGIPGMKEGGTRRLLIPASLAYGPNPPQGSNIPPNADLVFDVTVTKVGQ